MEYQNERDINNNWSLSNNPREAGKAIERLGDLLQCYPDDRDQVEYKEESLRPKETYCQLDSSEDHQEILVRKLTIIIIIIDWGKEEDEWRPFKLLHYWERPEYWGVSRRIKETCCCSNSSERLLANTYAKNSQGEKIMINSLGFWDINRSPHPDQKTRPSVN